MLHQFLLPSSESDKRFSGRASTRADRSTSVYVDRSRSVSVSSSSDERSSTGGTKSGLSTDDRRARRTKEQDDDGDEVGDEDAEDEYEDTDEEEETVAGGNATTTKRKRRKKRWHTRWENFKKKVNYHFLLLLLLYSGIIALVLCLFFEWPGAAQIFFLSCYGVMIVTRTVEFVFGLMNHFRSRLWDRRRQDEMAMTKIRRENPVKQIAVGKEVEEKERFAVSVLVPVKNEEDNIFLTLKNIAKTNYPLKKFEIVVINDGSDDGTSTEIARFLSYNEKKGRSMGKATISDVCEIGGGLLHLSEGWVRVQFLDFEKNRGKRCALLSGYKVASGEVMVMIDSDTMLDPDSIGALVYVLEVNPRAAASCGEVTVENESENLLTRAQTLEYFLGYNLVKAFEGWFRVVTCLPGCFSCVRRTQFEDVIELWGDQWVRGVPLNYAEDRQLTQLLLSRFQICFSDAARAKTIVPNRMAVLLRQRLRWTKGWVINVIEEVTWFLFRKPLFPSIHYYLLVMEAVAMPPLSLLTLATAVYFLCRMGSTAATTLWAYCAYGLMLYWLVIVTLLALVFWRPRLVLYIPIYFFLMTFLNMWLMLASVATLTDNQWGSRFLTTSSSVPPPQQQQPPPSHKGATSPSSSSSRTGRGRKKRRGQNIPSERVEETIITLTTSEEDSDLDYRSYGTSFSGVTDDDLSDDSSVGTSTLKVSPLQIQHAFAHRLPDD